MKKSVIFAILIGQLWLNAPVLIFLLGFPSLTWSLLKDVSIGIVFFLILILSIVIGFVLAWRWWAFFIPHWRIWAFKAVEENNWIQLKAYAISTGLIWEDGVVFEKTEKQNPIQQYELLYIEERIEELKAIKAIKDDLATPGEMTFYLNKRGIIIELFIRVFVVGMGIANIYYLHWVIGLFIIIAALLIDIDFVYIRKLNDKRPILMIDEEGIYVDRKAPRFWSWEELSHISFHKRKNTFTLHLVDQDIPTKTFSLRYIQIKNYDTFWSTLGTYIDRFHDKLEWE